MVRWDEFYCIINLGLYFFAANVLQGFATQFSGGGFGKKVTKCQFRELTDGYVVRIFQKFCIDCERYPFGRFHQKRLAADRKLQLHALRSLTRSAGKMAKLAYLDSCLPKRNCKMSHY